jgi:hypothetical protein
MVVYDNLDDAKAKLVSTFVTYEGKAAFVKDVKKVLTNYFAVLSFSDRDSLKSVSLDDPKFNYMTFNIGYQNCSSAAIWWCRIPVKQWQQGLKHSQCKYYVSQTPDDFMPQLGWNKYTIDMLEDNYPKFETVQSALLNGKCRSRAFHRDFALIWNPIHKDFIVDYKGKSVGHLSSRKDVALMEDFEHLHETLKEVLG